MPLPKIFLLLTLVVSALFLNSCATPKRDTNDSKMIVSVKDQKMLLTQFGQPVKAYPISTSKFGLGDTPNSMRTPLGTMKVAKKIGHRQPHGAVFKSRKPTGEVIEPNAPGRDPIITRIFWLKGTERRNKNAFRRYIYIHGTPEERRLGEKASYGCIRMGSEDIVDLYKRVGLNADVQVIRGSLTNTLSGMRFARMAKASQEKTTSETQGSQDDA